MTFFVSAGFGASVYRGVGFQGLGFRGLGA